MSSKRRKLWYLIIMALLVIMLAIPTNLAVAKSKPEMVNVSVKGVKELKLVVEFGEAMDTMDRAVWADAVLVKK